MRLILVPMKPRYHKGMLDDASASAHLENFSMALKVYRVTRSGSASTGGQGGNQLLGEGWVTVLVNMENARTEHS